MAMDSLKIGKHGSVATEMTKVMAHNKATQFFN